VLPVFEIHVLPRGEELVLLLLEENILPQLSALLRIITMTA
jgi:hypothetical protein